MYATHLQSIHQLFYDSFNRFFAFNSYYNHTLRSSDSCVVGSDNCVSHYLAQNVADNNFLTGSAYDLNTTFSSDHFHFRYFNTFVCSRSFSSVQSKYLRSNSVREDNRTVNYSQTLVCIKSYDFITFTVNNFEANKRSILSISYFIFILFAIFQIASISNRISNNSYTTEDCAVACSIVCNEVTLSSQNVTTIVSFLTSAPL